MIDELSVGPAAGTDNATSFDLRKPHPYIGFKSGPNADRIKYPVKYSIKTNRYGHRSPNLPHKKPEGVYRIAMVGGSVVFHGKHNNHTLISLMGQKLEKIRGQKVEFINAGIISGISNMELAVLVHELVDLDIDLLVSLNGFNDAYHYLYYNGHIGWPPFRWDNVGTERTRHLNQLAPSFYPAIKPIKEPSDAQLAAVMHNYLNSIDKMARISKSYGISYLATLQPMQGYTKKLCKTGKLKSMHAFYCAVGKEFTIRDRNSLHGAQYKDLSEYMRSDEFTDGVHINEVARVRLAAKLVELATANRLFAKN